MPKITLKQGGQTREIVLAKDNFSIGRTPENDLELKDALISRRHSSIIRRGDKCVVYDLGSSNGTYVNRTRVETKSLEHGDTIRVGDTEILFHDDVNNRVAAPRGGTARIEEKPAAAAAGGDFFGARQLVQHVDNIAENFNFDISDALSKGLSLKEIRPEVGGERAAKDSKMFFILFQVGKALSTAASLEDMLATATKLIFEVISAERCVILFTQEDGQVLPRLAYHKGAGPVDVAGVRISKTITSQVVNDKVGVITSDALQDPRFMQGLSIIQVNIRSALCVPLWEEKKVYGAIYLDNLVKSYAFTKEDLELLTAIANLIAIRIRQEETQAQLRREEMLRSNLAKYHSPDVVNMLMSRGSEVVELQVVEREVSVIFIDVESSTRLAEDRGPVEVANLLNEFFRMGTEAVFAYKGNVNKFIGDSVMALYNAPLDMPDHAEAAVRTCIRMIEEVGKFSAANPDRKFNIRCGVNSGITVAGNVGTATRMEYTVLGDAVNVAARLCKFPQVNSVIVGERTYELVKDRFKAKDLGNMVLKGKEKPLHAYEIDLTSGTQ